MAKNFSLLFVFFCFPFDFLQLLFCIFIQLVKSETNQFVLTAEWLTGVSWEGKVSAL